MKIKIPSKEISVTYSLSTDQIERLGELTERYNALMMKNETEESMFSFIMRTGSLFTIEKAMDQYDKSLVALETCGFCGGVV